MLFSLAYLALRWFVQLLLLAFLFTVDTIWLGRLYVLFFIELGSRRVHLADCTPNPSGDWVAQQARNLSWSLQEREAPLRFLIRDRDSKFTHDFDEVFRSEGLEIIRTPFRARRRTRSLSASSARSAPSASTGSSSPGSDKSSVRSALSPTITTTTAHTVRST